MAKVTMSRDGKKRMNLRVEHRVGKDDLTRFLCLAASKVMDWQEEFPENPSATWILDKVRDSLWHYGRAGADYWSDDVPEDEVDEIEAWAGPAVNGAFPELEV